MTAILDKFLKILVASYETPKTVEQAGAVYVIVPKERQQQAMDFLSKMYYYTWRVNQWSYRQ